MSVKPVLEPYYAPQDWRDRFAYSFVRFLRFFADAFFARRYGHRAVGLETVAAVPGMVGGALQVIEKRKRCNTVPTMIEFSEDC